MKTNNSLKSAILAALYYGIGGFLFRFGMAGWHRKLHEFAMKQLQKASHKQHPKAQQLMAKLLAYRGEGVLDKRAGVDLLALQAQKGDAQSQFLYAEMLLKSEAISSQSQTQAAKWYLAAAEQGHAMAALRLSKAYRQGQLGLKADPNLADYWSTQFMQHSKNMSLDS